LKSISILGCGWLGLPLAKNLIQAGISIKGSTTSVEKIDLLRKEGIIPFLIDLKEENVLGNVFDFLYESEILIIDIPPKLRGENKENFVQKIQNLIPFIEASKIKKVLFISSTSVYGTDNDWVTEETIPNPDTEGGKQLVIVEKILQTNLNFQTTVLRFGGLIGPQRHPIKQMAGKQNIENPEAPVNLIHQEDCINIISKIIEGNHFPEIFNAVAPFHPTKKEYYSQKAVKLNLPLPSFKESTIVSKKIISSLKVEEKLVYTFNLSLYL
jgi:nucleoside-diphosphate-sugar epimerase